MLADRVLLQCSQCPLGSLTPLCDQDRITCIGGGVGSVVWCVHLALVASHTGYENKETGVV